MRPVDPPSEHDAAPPRPEEGRAADAKGGAATGGPLGALRRRAAPLEPWIPTLAFLGGFGWDSLTLSRVDKLTDNALLLIYLLVLGGLMVLQARVARAPEAWPRLAARQEWARWGIQFLFGGLLSAYLIFYFKSATPGRTLLFLAGVVALMLLNEFWTERLRLDRLWLPLYGVCWFSFLLFFLPVVTGYLGVGVFSASALGGLGAVAAAALAIHWRPGIQPAEWLPGAARPTAGAGAALVCMFLLDLLGIIPPIPLALMERGIFHEVALTHEGYALTWEDHWWPPWRQDDQPFYYRSGDSAWCFTSIFAPTGLDLTLVHVWERWDDEEGWLVTDEIAQQTVEGGRDGGWRTYTRKRRIEPGEWRVRVQTEGGRELGRLTFDVVDDGEGTDERTWETRLAE